jgi:hypothetical protein
MNCPKKLKLVRETLTLLSPGQVNAGGTLTLNDCATQVNNGCTHTFLPTGCGNTLTEGANCTVTRVASQRPCITDVITVEP